MNNPCFLNNDFVDGQAAALPLSDLAIQRGYAVFDYLRTFNRVPFHASDHIKRLRNSANKFRIETELTDGQILEILHELIARTEHEEVGVRFFLTGGQLDSSGRFTNCNFVALAEKLPEYPNSIYENGISLGSYEYRREFPEVKSINYMNSLFLEPLKKEKGVYEFLYHHAGQILECPKSNFFAFFGDTLVTPNESILIGITRGVLLELASSDYKVEQRRLTLEQLSNADEAFICSSSINIIPVTSVDSTTFNDNLVGDKTRKLTEIFLDYAAKPPHDIKLNLLPHS